MIHALITLQGLVQGVGFRPFVYRLAREHAVRGYVANAVTGVIIEVEGSVRAVSDFIREITVRKPPLALIDDLQIRKIPLQGPGRFHSFNIEESRAGQTENSLLPPDLDLCAPCLIELFTAGARRYHYPFINCTDCGPRHTIIENLPYDRQLTAMKGFALCPLCAAEYQDPTNRRFHAQGNGCWACGPQLQLADSKGQLLPDADPLKGAVASLAQGHILAMKGLGGFHLAVDARNEKGVARLRQRKSRPHKPLAVMAPDLSAVRLFATITAAEEKWLCGREKPIVLLRQSTEYGLAASVAPGQRFIGVMLPYTPLHYLLLRAGSFSALVMTSGNRPGEPTVKDNHEAVARLAGIADGFLWHDRPIINRNDDSVIKLSDNSPVFLRRSRSFAPLPLLLPYDNGCTLALGGAEKNTICLTKGRRAYLSQHLGDLDSPAGLAQYEATINYLQQVLRIEPDLVVHDLHPDYPSSRYGAGLARPRVAVQHHHAHAVSCMAEHDLTGPVLAIVLDGSGYGTDGTIWGGEVLLATTDQFERLAHFTPFPMPGGELAIRQPWRLALGQLHNAYGLDILQLNLPVLRHHRQELVTLEQMMKKGLNSPLTSSCGRLFDAVAALVGLREVITYEGQAAMELEMLCDAEYLPDPYSYSLEKAAAGCWQMNPAPMIREIILDLAENKTPAEVSNRFHQTIATILQQTCRRLRDTKGLAQVVLSGGVFQNLILRDRLTGLLAADGFRVLNHRRLPPNDGGLALGQAVAGRAIYRTGGAHGVA
jgi:hydrogenase maturation protein HypF